MQQQIISQSDCDVGWKVDFIPQRGMTSSMTGLRRRSKDFPKPNLHPKRSWSLFGGLLPVWPTTAFWILVKPLHLRSMLSKSMRFTENCKACSYIDNRMGPIFIHNNAWPHVTQPTLQKLNVLGYKVLPHLPYSPGISPNDSHFFKYLDNFLLGKMLPQPTGCRNSFPRVPQIPKHGFLCYRNKQTYFLLAKVYWL